MYVQHPAPFTLHSNSLCMFVCIYVLYCTLAQQVFAPLFISAAQRALCCSSVLSSKYETLSKREKMKVSKFILCQSAAGEYRHVHMYVTVASNVHVIYYMP